MAGEEGVEVCLNDFRGKNFFETFIGIIILECLVSHKIKIMLNIEGLSRHSQKQTDRQKGAGSWA